jgi:hypothetical protein
MLTLGNRQFALCSDKSSNSNNEFVSAQRKIPSSGSGGGTLEKRSSYAVISDAFSQTVNNEFGSEYTDHLSSFASSNARSRLRI